MLLIHSAAQIVSPLGNGKFLALENAAVAGDETKIFYVGPTAEAINKFPDAQKLDATGKVVTPGFVDAHTHLLFAGDRSKEFLMRLGGATYQEIAEAGGGIQSTVRATRKASFDDLLKMGHANLKMMMQNGTTTAEIKSGYGLSWEHERKLLEVAKKLQSESTLDLAVTFLGAHDFPVEKSRDEYLREIVTEMLPGVVQQKLAEFCDVFCDQGYYTVDQGRAISVAAAKLGLKIKLHVDELADVNGAALAAECGAISADHLIFTNDDGIGKMAKRGVCAVLLPGTSVSLKSRQHAPARKMINAGVRVAIATDFNPGTCYCHSMQFILQLAPLIYGLTAEEALAAATLNGAAAIARDHLVGSLEPAKQMDCLIFAIPHYSYLFYNLGSNPLETVIKKGKLLWTKNLGLH